MLPPESDFLSSTCPHCQATGMRNYCSSCGQPATLPRIDAHYISHEIQHLLHFERGLLHTIRELLTKPGVSVRTYLRESRTRLVKPVVFIIIASLLYSVSSHFFHVEDSYYVRYSDTTAAHPSAIGLIFNWVQDHYGYANILMGALITLWAKIFFRKYGYNFFEILVLLCFVMGMAMLFLAVAALLHGLAHLNLMKAASTAGIVYCTWAIGQFFDQARATNYAKALGAYLLGMLTFAVLGIALGTIVDLLVTH